ncbi:ATP-dependent nuclease [Changpingibacter yushuensis]|uniref:ATP-dependent nuclease n=1 Tax=Changpingibacter yushuensis TaxID=2758440 RepID=UPI0015F64307|nr:AAA family ATPase [Changpingibacter yushuensis]
MSVRKYRSIDKAADFDVDDFTVLVGPNNQGKSNLLRAAVLAMEVIEGWSALPPGVQAGREVLIAMVLGASHRAGLRNRRRSAGREVGYNWEQDFPLFARERRGSQRSTVVHLDFELSPDEQAAFREETGISINQKLPLEVSLKERKVTLSIPKQGRGLHNEKAREIAKFVTDRITLLHIPAVRTSATALEIAEEILASRRRQLLSSPEYAEALEQLEELDRTAVADVESVLQKTLTRFMPGTDSVRLETRPLARATGLDDIFIDDGVPTPISAKGDGIQSLVALALTLEWTQSTSNPDKQLIIAVEEPESHLHPGAVHELRQVLQGIAESQQVIVTTHSQALINRRNLRQNVIVREHSATPAKSLDDLRIALGVRLSDALATAEVVVVSEGYLDELVLPVLLAQREPAIQDWLSDGRLIIESAGSGSKIYARVLAARSILTRPIVVLDSDPAGKTDVERLLADGVIEQTAVVQVVRPRCSHSELEDLLLQDAYLEALEKKVGFTLNPRQRRKLDQGRDKAWSERLAEILADTGTPDAGKLVKGCKHEVACAAVAAAERGAPVLRSECEDLLDRLVDVIRRSLHTH